MELVFRGVRGSVPTPEAGKLGFGGNTTCLEVALAVDHRLLIDCGTGLRSVEADLPAESGPRGLRFDVLLTHYHSDHLMGLPFFQPLYDARSRFTFYGCGWQGTGVQSALEDVIRPPWFPVSLSDTPSIKSYVELDGSAFSVGALRITYARLHHPQGVMAYRLDRLGRSLVFATDCESGDAACNATLRSLSQGADVLIHDSQYTPEEYEQHHRGWGHSTWSDAVDAASAAGVGRLILFHHDPTRSDQALEAIVATARRRFPRLDAAREGMTLPI